MTRQKNDYRRGLARDTTLNSGLKVRVGYRSLYDAQDRADTQPHPVEPGR